MELAIKAREIEWWFWAVTLAFIVTFTGRCFIALVLKVMPWNKDIAPGASCKIGSN